MPGATIAKPASATFELWGGVATVLVADPAGLADALAVVEATVVAFDAACSSFRSDSELATVNAASGAPVAVGPVLLDALGAALRAARITDGDVDPTVGLALIAHRLLPGGGALGPVSFEPVPGYRTVSIDLPTATVKVAGGVRLDLGATAKALAADRAAAAAADAAGCGVLVSLLGDLAIAGRPPAEGWHIRVSDDHRAGADAAGQTIMVREGGVATSSTTVREGHILDPRTGDRADACWRTVSVAAASCLDANIAATAAIVRGRRAAAWLEGQGVPARLVSAAGVAEHIGGWPADGDDL